MSAESLLYLIIGILSFDFILERILEQLNRMRRSPELPAELAPYYDAEKYRRSQQYHKEKDRLGTWVSVLNYVLVMLLLLTGSFGKLSSWLEQYVHNPIWLALVYFGILALAGSLINLPFGWYNTFVIEEKYGFNRTTVKTYITDKLKGILLTVVIGGVLGYLFLWLVLSLGNSFWLYAWAVMAAIIIFINLFYTSLIVPLFNKLSPLPDSELRKDIEAYSAKVDFPLTNIYVIDGSKRSNKANAYFSGLGRRKKIVLFDTLIQKHTNDELVSVLAHEAGHYKKKHIQQGLILSLLHTGFMLWLLSLFLFNENLSLALGGSEMKLHLNIVAIGILFGPISTLTGILMNILSRKNEFEADAYAAKTADKEAFKQALIKLSTDNLSNLRPHPAYVFFHYSHPPLLSRLKALEQL